MQTTKEKILDAVISYIKQPLDLNQVSISDIAKKAEIGKSTIYEYFDNKSALIEETYLHLLKNYEKTLMQDIASLEFESALKKQLTWILNVIEDAKNIMEVIMRGQIDIGFVKLNACSKKIEQVQRNMENRFIEIFQKGITKGIIEVKSKPYQQNIIQALINGLMFQYADGKIEINRADLIDLVYEEIMRVLK